MSAARPLMKERSFRMSLFQPNVRRAPRPRNAEESALSRDRIVATALKLIDAQGLEAFSSEETLHIDIELMKPGDRIFKLELFCPSGYGTVRASCLARAAFRRTLITLGIIRGRAAASSYPPASQKTITCNAHNESSNH